MATATQPKEKKDHVSFYRDGGQTQQINLHSSFSLKKHDMYAAKQPHGIDSFPERMAQIHNDLLGPKPTTPKLAEVVRFIIKDASKLEPGFLKNMNRSYTDYSN